MWAHSHVIDAARASATISYLVNSLSTYGTEIRLFGKTNPEVSQRYDTLITPKGWAFSIWALIFVGEAMGLTYIWTSSIDKNEYNNILIPFTYACILQSVWCVFFSKENMLLSAIALSGIAYCLKLCSDEIFAITVSESSSTIPYIAQALISYPIRIHFAWITAAMLINWNMLLVSLQIPGLEVLPALTSVWMAAGIGAFRAFFLGDAIFPAVIAWALAAMSGKIRSSPPEHFAKDTIFLEMLELTYNFLSLNMVAASVISSLLCYVFSLSDFEYVSYNSWVAIELGSASQNIFYLYLFIVWNIAFVQNFLCNKGAFQWR